MSYLSEMKQHLENIEDYTQACRRKLDIDPTDMAQIYDVQNMLAKASGEVREAQRKSFEFVQRITMVMGDESETENC